MTDSEAQAELANAYRDFQEARKRIAELENTEVLLREQNKAIHEQFAQNVKRITELEGLAGWRWQNKRIAELEQALTMAQQNEEHHNEEMRLAEQRIAELEEVLREIDQDPSQEILTDAQRKILEKGK